VLTLKAGDSTTPLIFRFDRLVLLDPWPTISVYVLVVTPSWAVTVIFTVLAPVLKGIAADADPDVTAVPFTFTVAAGLVVDWVTVTDATLAASLAVYIVVVVENPGDNAPWLILRLARLASEAALPVTVIFTVAELLPPVLLAVTV
jgi:hypothetical protein